MELTQEQKFAFDAVTVGHSICISGAAGSGKSFLLKEIISYAHANEKQIGVTSTTGASAILIGGRTLHSFLGFGLATKSAELLAIEAKNKRKKLVTKLRKLHILVIDEVSMLNDELFTKIDEYLRVLRRNEKHFGGVQLVLSGDFCQIPPVKGDFCFKSSTWQEMDIKKFVFGTLIRQKGDPQFQQILESLRWGECTPEILRILKSTSKHTFAEGIEPTILYSKNVDVDFVNNKKYTELLASGTPTQTYKTRYSDPVAAKAWGDSCKIPEAVEIAVGAQVMVTHNIDVDNGITNGTRGVVTNITSLGPIVKFVAGYKKLVEMFKTESEDDEGLYVTSMPLKLAYAITCHKSQGQTLDCVRMDLGSSIFEYGMAYTSLSRGKSLKSICVVDVIPGSFRTHPDVLEFYGRK